MIRLGGKHSAAVIGLLVLERRDAEPSLVESATTPANKAIEAG